jgi:hypothetical protein
MNDEDMALVKFDMQGKVTWEKIYAFPDNFRDEPIDMEMDDMGNIYVAVASAPAKQKTAVDFCIIKYSKDGAELWVKRWGTQPHAETPCGIEVRNGLVFVSGTSAQTAGPASGPDFHSKIYNAETGDEIWSHSWNGLGVDRSNSATDMTLDLGGNLVVVGTSQHPNDDYSIVRYKWDTIPPKKTTDSAKIVLVYDWERWYNGSLNQWDAAQFVTTNNNGDIYVTGYAHSKEGRQDIATVKYDRKGNQKWVRIMNGTANNRDEPIGIGVDSKGNVIVTGYLNNVKTKEDYCIIKYDTDGDTLWTTAWWDMAPASAKPSAMTVGKDDHIYVAGASGISGEPYARKLDPDGKIVWETVIKSPEGKPMPGGIQKMCMDGRGNLYFTGLYINEKGMTLFLTKYAAN